MTTSRFDWRLAAVLGGVFAGVLAMAAACGSTSSQTSWGSSSGSGSPGPSAAGSSSGGANGSGSGAGPTATTTPDAASGASGSSSGSTGSANPGVADGGSSPSSDAAATMGCGAASWPSPTAAPPAGSLPIQQYSLDVGGTTRTFVVGLPSTYASSRSYPVVFAWHGAGGTATQVATGGTSSRDLFNGYYGLRYQSEQQGRPTIFVAGQGLDANDAGTGWPNTNGQDVAFTQAMVAWLEQNYCIDSARIYSVGMSYGGIMSNTVGCATGDVFRAITPMSGLGPLSFGRAASCKGQVAVWLAHGTQDTTVPFDAGQASRDFWVNANHCSSTTVPTTPAECVAYQGCDPGYPVDWCTFDAGHTMETFEPQGIWAFLQQF